VSALQGGAWGLARSSRWSLPPCDGGRHGSAFASGAFAAACTLALGISVSVLGQQAFGLWPVLLGLAGAALLLRDGLQEVKRWARRMAPPGGNACSPWCEPVTVASTAAATPADQ
jgi:hypothetical protein